MVGEMNRNQEVYFEIAAQTLYHDAPSFPSAASVSVFEADYGDDGTAESAITGSVTLPTVNTTVSATSGDGETNPKLVTLTSVAGIVRGLRYLLTNTTGETEWGEVLEIGTTDVTLRSALKNSYAVGATFQGTRMSAVVATDWVSDVDAISTNQAPHPRYRARWAYTAGGVPVVRPVYFDVWRYQSSTGVTALDVDQIAPGFLDTLATDYRADQGASLIVAAERAVRMDLYADEKAMAMARNPEAMDELVAYRASLTHEEDRLRRGSGTVDSVDVARDRYSQRYNQLVRSGITKWGDDSSGAAHVAPRVPIFQR